MTAEIKTLKCSQIAFNKLKVFFYKTSNSSLIVYNGFLKIKLKNKKRDVSKVKNV